MSLKVVPIVGTTGRTGDTVDEELQPMVQQEWHLKVLKEVAAINFSNAANGKNLEIQEVE